MSIEVGEDSVSVSSIDANWPPCDSSNERIRGFYPEVLKGDQALQDFAEEFERASHKVDDSSEGVTRVSFRAVTDKATVLALTIQPEITIEAAMPLYGTGYDDKLLVYTGYNAINRRASEEDFAKHRETIRAASKRYGEAAVVDTIRGYYTTPRIITTEDAENDPSIEGKLLELYSAFGLDTNEVGALLANPTNLIAVLEASDGNFVSTVLAETANIALEDQPPLRIAEITEAVTLPSKMGMGYYSTLSRFLVDQVQKLAHEEKKNIHALYGESNLSSVGVIFAAAKNGRRFNIYDRSNLSIENQNFGILPQNFRVSDGVETRSYNDFALTYYPLS